MKVSVNVTDLRSIIRSLECHGEHEHADKLRVAVDCADPPRPANQPCIREMIRSWAMAKAPATLDANAIRELDRIIATLEHKVERAEDAFDIVMREGYYGDKPIAFVFGPATAPLAIKLPAMEKQARTACLKWKAVTTIPQWVRAVVASHKPGGLIDRVQGLEVRDKNNYDLILGLDARLRKMECPTLPSDEIMEKLQAHAHRLAGGHYEPKNENDAGLAALLHAVIDRVSRMGEAPKALPTPLAHRKAQEKIAEDVARNDRALNPQVGDLVYYPPESGRALRSGAEAYSAAVLVSLDPLVLVSTCGDMIWYHMPREYLRAHAPAHPAHLVAAMRRLHTELCKAQGDLKAAEQRAHPLVRFPGLAAIASERRRQVEREGYDAAHDRQHHFNDLARAAACYATPPTLRESGVPSNWPWDAKHWKPDTSNTPKGRFRELEKAGALIAAAIDRLRTETA